MPMKVIVCFDGVRVTVPCGDGNIPVTELITKAVHRYKRATGKGPDHWVEVTSLKTISGGGILDPDDQLNDVVDDREQLIADFDEPNRGLGNHIHNSRDGASSTGTTSPEVFHGRDSCPSSITSSHQHTNSSSSSNNNTDVIITTKDLSLGSNLRVRRGSDPGLHLVEDTSNDFIIKPPFDQRPSIPRRESVRESDEPRSESSDDEKRVKMAAYGSLDRKRLGNRFIRDATRASLSNHRDMSRWIESQEHKANRLIVKEQDQIDNGVEETSAVNGQNGSVRSVCLQIDGGPLGIHAVPATDEKGGDLGLLVQSVEPGRPVHQDGRIQPSDIIVEINNKSLRNVPFVRAQEVFRSAMQSNEIHLKTLRQNNVSQSVPPPSLPTSKSKRQAMPPPVMPKPRSHTPVKPSPLTLPSQKRGGDSSTSPVPTPRDSSLTRKPSETKDQCTNGAQSQPNSHPTFRPGRPVRGSSLHSSSSSSSSIQNSAPDSISRGGHAAPPPPPVRQKSVTDLAIKPGPPIKPAKKVPPPAIPSRNPKTQLSSPSVPAEAPVSLNALTNTRRIGNKIHILLKKGPLGLGFSVTSRDNPTSGDCPIYIRNILPKGAAIQDGQLRPGDRLLQVNGQEMTGKSQAEAVSLLRLISMGSTVELVVSRQEEVEERFKMPRPLDAGGNAALGGASNAQVRLDDDRRIEDKSDVPDALSSPQPAHAPNDLGSPPGVAQEVLVFHIPLNDTGSAGLGVSVKGKTQTTDSGTLKDLGIFIKTVLQGGAASKDGRLQVNDQLLGINDVNLVDLPNYSAMEALRVAMMDDGLSQGHIKLMIARYSGGTISLSSFEESPNSSQGEVIPPDENTSEDNIAGTHVGGHRRSSSSATETSSSHLSAFSSSKELPSPIPPVRSKRVSTLRDKFNDLGNALRNESYTRATHDSLNDSAILQGLIPSPRKPADRITSPGSPPPVPGRNEKEVYSLTNAKIKRPHSTIGFLHGDQVDSYNFGGGGDTDRHAPVVYHKDDSDLSPVGDLTLPFSREGFGRQSMSEKRKGHIDPRSTEVYKQAKANKDIKGSHDDLDPSRVPNASPARPPSMVHASTYHQPQHPHLDARQSNMKRVSSLEDIAHIPRRGEAHRNPSHPNEVHQKREPSPSMAATSAANRFGRARACNDSFRAAVDRSYEVMDPTLMDTLEEESVDSAVTQDPSFSGRSSISSENTAEDTNSLKRSKVKDKEKKGGLLKGFLRFGKGRKSSEEAMRRSRSEERSANHARKEARRVEHSAERSSSNRVLNDRWAQPLSNDAAGSDLGFYVVTEHDRERRRRSSQQGNERVEDEYARLRSQHLSNQRLRSQSVDPSMGREDRSSPFQPYIPQQAQQATHYSNRNMADVNYYHQAATSHAHMNKSHASEAPAISNYSNHSLPSHEAKSNVVKAAVSRAEKIQQLRSMYQHRHRQRQGVYPLDDAEEEYERQIKETEDKFWASPDDMNYDPNAQHYTQSLDRHQRDRPTVSLSSSNNIKNSSASSYHYHYQQQQQQHLSRNDYRYPGSPHSRNNSAESVPYDHEQMYFYQHPHHHPHQHQHPHPHPHHPAHASDHSDQEELTSFTNNAHDSHPSNYHHMMPVYTTAADDGEAHPFYHHSNTLTQFHSGNNGVQYSGHYRTNATAHSDSAKV